jgi:DNA-binding LacI/PurR family transcriptional regulator
MAKIRDIAVMAGVSTAVVSAVLRGSTGSVRYSTKTAEAVHRACEELHYTRNLAANYLHAKRTYSIGVIVFNLCDEYCSTVLAGVESELAGTSYSLLLSDTRRDETRVQQYLTLFRQKRVDGIVVVGCSDQTVDTVCEQSRMDSIPTIIVGTDLSDRGVPSVLCDQVGGAYQATRHLIESGHVRIAGVFDDIEIRDARERLLGMRNALDEAQIETDHRLFGHCFPSTNEFETGYEAMRGLLRKPSVRQSITAVFVGGGDAHAIGAIRALAEAGLRVPQDISVVGFGDLMFTAYSQPSLTTVAQPMREMGVEAARLLLRLLNHELPAFADSGCRSVLATRLIVRSSSVQER